jgi:acyl-CoA thioester hydrolase
VSVEIEVRYRDMDANAHVNNAVYFTYFEQARIAYFTAVRGGASPGAVEIPVVIAEATCRYRSPATLGEVLVVGVRVSAMRRSSFTMEYAVRERESGRLVATGTTVQVVYDFARGRVRGLRPEVRQAIQRFEEGAL